MGPRPRGRGWSPAPIDRTRGRGASMGPRPRGRGWSAAAAWAMVRTWLQWGHGREAVDGGLAGGLTLSTWCFNGATAARPWMGSSRTSALRRRSSFNGATAARPWMVSIADSSSQAWNCFNGATAARPWMAGASPSRAASWSASMGPRPRGRGWFGARDALHWLTELQWGHGREAVDGYRPSSTTARPLGFNGATAARPWMAHCSAPRVATTECFNGATAARPWMA